MVKSTRDKKAKTNLTRGIPENVKEEDKTLSKEEKLNHAME